MANRHLQRSIAMQSLFEWDFQEAPPERLPAIVKKNTAEFAPGLADTSFINNLTAGVAAKRSALDLIIEKAAPDWPISRIAVVDRNILRLGLFEMLFGDREAVPARVAINEAIELAKTFGGEQSGKFVNGVLGTVYREMGEPDRDEIPAKKRRVKNLPLDALPVENLGGAVVFTREGGKISLAFVHDVFGYWTLSKGHLLAGEDPATGTAREVKEELSLSINILGQIGVNEYLANDPRKGQIKKRVTYFLAEARDGRQALQLTKQEGLDDARWFDLPEVVDLKMYDDMAPIIKRGIEMIETL